MSPEFMSLLKKEWLERRKAFWWGVVILLYYVGFCVAYQIEYRTRAMIGSFYFGGYLYVTIASIVLSMSTVAGEYSRGTLRFSSALPVSLSKIGWSRLLMTWICVIGPLLIANLIVSLIFGSGLIEQFEPRSFFEGTTELDIANRPSVSRLVAIGLLWQAAMIQICTAIYLSTIISLLGTWCRREATVGFLGVLVTLAAVSSTGMRFRLEASDEYLFTDWIGVIAPNAMALVGTNGQLDGSSYTELLIFSPIVGAVILNLLLSLGLATWFASRYGKRSRSISVASRKSWRPRLPRTIWGLPKLGSSQNAALAWLNLRQALPLCLAGFTIVGLKTWAQVNFHSPFGATTGLYFSRLPEESWMIGHLWAAVVAVSVFGSETKPESEEFWRSKPISPASWFWFKFIVGLTAVILSFNVVPILLERLLCHGKSSLGVISSLSCLTIVLALVYTIAVAVICRTRRPLLATIAAPLIYYSLEALMKAAPASPKISPMLVYTDLNMTEVAAKPLNFVTSGFFFVFGAVAALILLATLVARRSIVPANSLRITKVILVFSLVCGNAKAEEPTSSLTQEVIRGIEQFESSVKNLHLKFVTEEHFKRLEPLEATPRRRRRMRRPETIDSIFKYEFWQEGGKLAWQQFNQDDSLRTAMLCDGMRQYNYGVANLSSVWDQQSSQTAPYSPDPRSLLVRQLNGVGYNTLLEFLRSQEFNSIESRDENGERLIEFSWHHHRSSPYAASSEFDERKIEIRTGWRCKLTINASRQYWPVKTFVEFLVDDSGHAGSRTESIATDWLDSNSILFPRIIHQTKTGFMRNVTHHGRQDVLERSDSAVNTRVTECHILEMSANTELPENTFAIPIPTDVPYYDSDAHHHYSMDKSGQAELYLPKPKGIEGAVFGYFLISFVAVAAYLLWPSQQSASI